jgi:TatD DNase family protein
MTVLTQVWASFGIHPHDANSYTPEIEQKIASKMNHEKCVAWGEIGLDYHYNHSPPEVQQRVFTQQLKVRMKTGGMLTIQMAIEHKKPIVIHTREAEEDTCLLMKLIVPRDWPVHVHCFTSSLPFAHILLNYWSNLYIGFTGTLSLCLR